MALAQSGDPKGNARAKAKYADQEWTLIGSMSHKDSITAAYLGCWGAMAKKVIMISNPPLFFPIGAKSPTRKTPAIYENERKRDRRSCH